ncbi:MAG: hypothetical protein H7X95_04610 [Deltaproteobacteria bacterium]|nr:hypothetical protein [Deltaproteobacteria bacterium]
MNAVYALVQRSAIYSVQQQFVDRPTREKGQFLGDAVNISLATMSAFLERDAYTTRADQITAAINARLRRPDGVYVPGGVGCACQR